jgi:serine phosphatase RsbU (regulator of sigma subunit)
MVPTVSDHGRRKGRSQAYDDTPPMFAALCDTNSATRRILRKALLEPQKIRTASPRPALKRIVRQTGGPIQHVGPDDELNRIKDELVEKDAELHRLREYGHRIAQALQHPFPQGSLPDLARFGVRAACRPAASMADAGGGWSDVFRLPDGRIGFSIGDVAGHGVQAAVRTVQVRDIIRAFAFEGHAPFFVLSRTSQFLGLISHTQGWATAVFGILDPQSGTVTYANAGPTQPILATSDGRVGTLSPGGPALNVRTQTLPPTRTVRLSKGALLVFYSDGAVVGQMNLLHGARAEVSAPTRDPAQAILDRAFGEGRYLDGIALLTIMV